MDSIPERVDPFLNPTLSALLSLFFVALKTQKYNDIFVN